jgi:hypothetical protein
MLPCGSCPLFGTCLVTTTLITGIPRSGTTLVCSCLNTLPNCVALAEPMTPPRHGDIGRAVDEIVSFASATRSGILANGTAAAKTVDGTNTDNFFDEPAAGGEARRHVSSTSTIRIQKPLSRDFRLFIKHPALFTALAEPLARAFPLFAVVRHPLAALASWQSVSLPVSEGQMPVAEAFSPELRKNLAGIGDRLGRQVALVRWMFDCYRCLPKQNVVPYESIVRSPSAALEALAGPGISVTHPVQAIEARRRYPGIDFAAIANALLAIESHVEPFYPNFADSLLAYLDRPGR